MGACRLLASSHGVGARGSSGLSALQLTMAGRAHQLEPVELDLGDGTRAAVGLCRAVGRSVTGRRRYVELAAPALVEASAGRASPEPIAVVVALPDHDRPDQSAERFDAGFLAELTAAAGLALDARGSAIVRAGHAGFAWALARGIELLEEGRREVLVGAVDSPCDPAVLRWMRERGWLQCDVGDQARLPSEAAGFVRLAFSPASSGRARATIANIERVRDQAPNPTAVARCWRRAAMSLSGRRHRWVLSDLNGEKERAREWAQVERSAGEVLRDVVHDEWAARLGDLGAATGAVLFAVAVTLARTGAVEHPSASLALHADGPERAVIAIELPSAAIDDFRASVGTAAPLRSSTAPAATRPPSEGELGQMRAAARGCLEDIGSLGLLLAPGEIGPEYDPTRIAQRLLDARDALFSLAHPVGGSVHLADLPAVVQRYLGEVRPMDPARRFAGAFTRAAV
jgi:3-oxoacyl-[acyl-carrier-protein] synthase I